MKRKVWPIFAWASGALFVTMLALIYLASFADTRWWPLACANIFTLVAMGLLAVSFWEGGGTYEKKPRGWRKERRRAEKEAYIRRLEQELFND